MSRKHKRNSGGSAVQNRLRKELYSKMSSHKRSRSFKISNFFLFRWIRLIFSVFPKVSLKPRTTREISGIIFFFFAVFSFLGLIHKFGPFGETIGYWLRTMFGSASFVIPLILIAMGVRLLTYHDKADSDSHSSRAKQDNMNHLLRLYIGCFILIAFLMSIFHLGIPYDEIQAVAEAGRGGGYFGFTMSFFMRPIFSDFGTFVVCFFSIVASFLFAFEIPLKKVYVFLKSFFNPTVVKGPAGVIREKIMQVKPVGLRTDEKKKVNKPDEKPGEFTIRQFTPHKGVEWEYPNLNLLDFEPFHMEKNEDEIKYYQDIIRKTLRDFNINVEMDEVYVGPTVTQYTFKPEAGMKLSKIVALKNDLALALAADSIRIEAPIPGKSLVGIEIPNTERMPVKLRDILESDGFNDLKSNLRLVLGRDINGNPVVADLASMPHLLVAGATGSGKSVAINVFLMSLLFQNSPLDLRLILVDPKRVEMAAFNGIPHLLTPVITSPQKTVSALRWAVAEMDRRYQLLAEKGHKNIKEFNTAEPKEERLSYIVIVIDELADLMMVASKEVEGLICRLAQMARAIGIHLIVATQRPSVDVVTGLIKANIPGRIAFTVSSGVDSRTILDSVGAENLLGRGDMLYLPGNESRLYRIQGVYVEKHEIEKVLHHIKLTKEPDYDKNLEQTPPPQSYTMPSPETFAREDKLEVVEDLVLDSDYKIPGVDSFDALDDESTFKLALALVQESKKASASFLQRRLKLGYSRAARMIDLLEERGYIGPAQGSKPREVYE